MDEKSIPEYQRQHTQHHTLKYLQYPSTETQNFPHFKYIYTSQIVFLCIGCKIPQKIQQQNGDCEEYKKMICTTIVQTKNDNIYYQKCYHEKDIYKLYKLNTVQDLLNTFNTVKPLDKKQLEEKKNQIDRWKLLQPMIGLNETYYRFFKLASIYAPILYSINDMSILLNHIFIHISKTKNVLLSYLYYNPNTLEFQGINTSIRHQTTYIWDLLLLRIGPILMFSILSTTTLLYHVGYEVYAQITGYPLHLIQFLYSINSTKSIVIDSLWNSTYDTATTTTTTTTTLNTIPSRINNLKKKKKSATPFPLSINKISNIITNTTRYRQYSLRYNTPFCFIQSYYNNIISINNTNDNLFYRTPTLSYIPCIKKGVYIIPHKQCTFPRKSLTGIILEYIPRGCIRIPKRLINIVLIWLFKLHYPQKKVSKYKIQYLQNKRRNKLQRRYQRRQGITKDINTSLEIYRCKESTVLFDSVATTTVTTDNTAYSTVDINNTNTTNSAVDINNTNTANSAVDINNTNTTNSAVDINNTNTANSAVNINNTSTTNSAVDIKNKCKLDINKKNIQEKVTIEGFHVDTNKQEYSNVKKKYPKENKESYLDELNTLLNKYMNKHDITINIPKSQIPLRIILQKLQYNHIKLPYRSLASKICPKNINDIDYSKKDCICNTINYTTHKEIYTFITQILYRLQPPSFYGHYKKNFLSIRDNIVNIILAKRGYNTQRLVKQICNNISIKHIAWLFPNTTWYRKNIVKKSTIATTATTTATTVTVDNNKSVIKRKKYITDCLFCKKCKKIRYKKQPKTTFKRMLELNLCKNEYPYRCFCIRNLHRKDKIYKKKLWIPWKVQAYRQYQLLQTVLYTIFTLIQIPTLCQLFYVTESNETGSLPIFYHWKLWKLICQCFIKNHQRVISNDNTLSAIEFKSDYVCTIKDENELLLSTETAIRGKIDKKHTLDVSSKDLIYPTKRKCIDTIQPPNDQVVDINIQINDPPSNIYDILYTQPYIIDSYMGKGYKQVLSTDSHKNPIVFNKLLCLSISTLRLQPRNDKPRPIVQLNSRYTLYIPNKKNNENKLQALIMPQQIEINKYIKNIDTRSILRYIHPIQKLCCGASPWRYNIKITKEQFQEQNLTGYAIYGVNHTHIRINKYIEKLYKQKYIYKTPLYIATTDIKSCYDSINPYKIYEIIEKQQFLSKYTIRSQYIIRNCPTSSICRTKKKYIALPGYCTILDIIEYAKMSCESIYLTTIQETIENTFQKNINSELLNNIYTMQNYIIKWLQKLDIIESNLYQDNKMLTIIQILPLPLHRWQQERENQPSYSNHLYTPNILSEIFHKESAYQNKQDIQKYRWPFLTTMINESLQNRQERWQISCNIKYNFEDIDNIQRIVLGRLSAYVASVTVRGNIQPGTIYTSCGILNITTEDKILYNPLQVYKNIFNTVTLIETKEYIMKVLQEHLFNHIIHIHGQFMLQRYGIPQGSPISSLLANLYLGYIDTQLIAPKLLSIPHISDYLILRHMDDYILITPSKDIANTFVNIFHYILPKTVYLYTQPQKFYTNFSTKEPVQQCTQWVPWNGLLLSSQNGGLQVHINYTKLYHKGLLHTYICKPKRRSIKQILQYLLMPKLEYITLNVKCISQDTVILNIYQRCQISITKFLAIITNDPPRSQLSYTLSKKYTKNNIPCNVQSIVQCLHFGIHFLSRFLTSRFLYIQRTENIPSFVQNKQPLSILQIRYIVAWSFLTAFVYIFSTIPYFIPLSLRRVVHYLRLLIKYPYRCCNITRQFSIYKPKVLSKKLIYPSSKRSCTYILLRYLKQNHYKENLYKELFHVYQLLPSLFDSGISLLQYIHWE